MNLIRILIVDDNEVVREGLETLLQPHKDIEVIGKAVDGLDAIAKAEQLIPDIIQHMGHDLSNLRNLRWIFDSKRILMSKDELIKWIQSVVKKDKRFEIPKSGKIKEYPLIPQILEAIERMVVYWP